MTSLTPAPSGSSRPPRTFTTGTVTRALRGVSVVITVAGAVALVIRFASLPAIVPVHFNFSGAVDGYGPSWSVCVLAGAWVALMALLVVLSLKPRLFNYPIPLTEANAQRVYREGERMMVWVALAMAVAFAGIALAYFDVDGIAITMPAIICMLAATVVGIVRMMRIG